MAPFPEGFQGDMDEVFQQAYQNTTAVVEGNFITGLVLPPNSTLPTTDQGPIAMNGTWYFWDPTTNQYLAQVAPYKPAKNFVRNSCYQIAQQGGAFTLGAGVTQTYDLVISRAILANVLAIASDVGPSAGPDTDLIPAAIKYTVGPTLVPTLGATDLYTHEHLIEGSDIIMLQGQQMALSFSVYPTVAGTYSVYLTNGNRDQSYVTTFAISAAQVNTWVRVKIINIPAFPSGTGWHYGDGTTGLYIGFPMGVGAQFQSATLNAWRSGLFCGSAQNINMLTVVNNQLKVTGIKLEASPSSTYLQVPSFGLDFEEMQRYYTTSFDYQSTTSGWGIITAASAVNTVLFTQQFFRRMCQIPTVTPYGWVSNAAGQVTNISTSTDAAQATLGATRKGIAATITPTAAKGDAFAAKFRADARIS